MTADFGLGLTVFGAFSLELDSFASRHGMYRFEPGAIASDNDIERAPSYGRGKAL